MNNKGKLWARALGLSVLANLAAIAVTLWEHAQHGSTGLWFSSTFFFTVIGATLVALLVGLPLNIITFVNIAPDEGDGKRYSSAAGIVLSLTPWAMPLLFG